MKTNILVCYEGGGYDGCYWEWNYFYIDKQGTFHDIQSSGRAGIDNRQDAEQLIERDETHTYIYNLSNKQDIETFSKETHPVHVSGVLQWFNDYNAHKAESFIDFFVVCSVCDGQISDHDDMTIEDKDLLCYDCYMAGECPCCESYIGQESIIRVNPDEHYDHIWICTDCKEYHDDEREAHNIEDIRWQAFCTGTPDMFSGELREQRLQTSGGL
ncbi:hypothetical protein LCGC14_0437520 [marine sediment metagenome]|uniref:Uncharacterized protein n=1 Tax=marine sediment metagenome TaxID=412755 RepID=A0A0F9V8F4_9ZZZZ